jgi:hypothetical protein
MATKKKAKKPAMKKGKGAKAPLPMKMAGKKSKDKKKNPFGHEGE